MDVELYVAYPETIEETAIKAGQKELFNNPNTRDEVAFIGVYHYQE